MSLSVRHLTSWVVDPTFIADGLFELITGDQTHAFLCIVVGGFGIILELRTHKEGDDWFNGRGTKLKKGVKRMLAGPRPRPAPAFGLAARDPTATG